MQSCHPEGGQGEGQGEIEDTPQWMRAGGTHLWGDGAMTSGM